MLTSIKKITGYMLLMLCVTISAIVLINTTQHFFTLNEWQDITACTLIVFCSTLTFTLLAKRMGLFRR
jgi:hypothetical protein